MAISGKRPRPGFNSLRIACEARLEEIKLHGDLTYEQLVDGSFWHRFVSADYHSLLPSYQYMGRGFTGDVVQFILDDTVASYRSTRAEGYIKYILGTSGFGKTISLNTAAVYLYLRSIKAVEAANQPREQMNPCSVEVSGTQSSINVNPSTVDISGLRFVLLTGRKFVEDPLEVLLAGLVMAYVKDGQALAELELLDHSNKKEFSWFLRQRPEKVIVLLDDGNAFDEEEQDPDPVKREKRDAFRFLVSLIERNVKVVVCASFGSKLRNQVEKECADYLLGTGGFSEDEVCNFITRKTGSTESSRALAYQMLASTGWVPRLVDQFLTCKPALKQTVRGLESDLVKYISKALLEFDMFDKDALLAAVAGQPIPRLSSVSDSRCYYRGPNGKAKCLTPALHAIAIGAVAKALDCSIGKATALAQINRVTQNDGEDGDDDD